MKHLRRKTTLFRQLASVTIHISLQKPTTRAPEEKLLLKGRNLEQNRAHMGDGYVLRDRCVKEERTRLLVCCCEMTSFRCKTLLVTVSAEPHISTTVRHNWSNYYIEMTNNCNIPSGLIFSQLGSIKIQLKPLNSQTIIRMQSPVKPQWFLNCIKTKTFSSNNSTSTFCDTEQPFFRVKISFLS